MLVKEEIENLKIIVLKMLDEVTKNIQDSIDYFLNKKIIEGINDDIIDQYERDVEELGFNILLKEKTYARDLKEVTGILKLVSDIERIGDHAEDIFSFAKKLNAYPKSHILEIDNLSKYVVQMMKDAIQSYINSDIELAYEVIKRDDYVDKKYLEIIENLSNHNSIDKDYILFAIYTTLVVKYLERIADHSVNISEWTIYIKSGFYKDKQLF